MTPRVFAQEEVTTHFDTLAAIYDTEQQRNHTYHQALIRAIRTHVPPKQRILEIGCGTGKILQGLQPSGGVGIDASPEMIARCRHKYPGGTWMHSSVEDFAGTNPDPFDVIVMADVVEHVADLHALFSHLPGVSRPGTRLVISMANPLWEPVLLLLERLHLKLTEGPHWRPSCGRIRRMLSPHGFALQSRTSTLLLPKHIPLLSPIAEKLEKFPLLRRLCLIEILEFTYLRG